MNTSGFVSGTARRSDQLRNSHTIGFMNNQKFYNPVQDEFQEDFIKRVGDTIFELELQPCLIYIGRIDSKGEKTYKKFHTNHRIDARAVKKHFRSEQLPFEELQLSRKTNLA